MGGVAVSQGNRVLCPSLGPTRGVLGGVDRTKQDGAEAESLSRATPVPGPAGQGLPPAPSWEA